MAQQPNPPTWTIDPADLGDLEAALNAWLDTAFRSHGATVPLDPDSLHQLRHTLHNWLRKFRSGKTLILATNVIH